MVTAYLGLGTNLGDRLQNLTQALEEIERWGVSVEEVSPIFETEPQGMKNQPWFLNMAVRVRTCLSPRKLLTTLQAIEAEMGRKRSVRWGPRLIDIDILLYEKEVISEPDLEIPHPRLTERAFVLYPLLEIDKDLCLPEGIPLRNFLESASNQGIRLYKPDADKL